MRLPRWRPGRGDFIRAVHYFGRSQPANFWDAAPLADVPRHLEQIRKDGFNTVILVVPWRGFQPTLSPPTLDADRLDTLRRLLAAVDAQGLQSILRVTYPWSHDAGSELSFDERALGLFTRPEIREAWLVYLGALRGIAGGARGFRFAFFSWEDLPSIRPLMAHRSHEERLRLAGATGFQAFLRSRFDLARVSEMFGEEFRDFSEVYIPLPVGEGYRAYNEFVNWALEDLLKLGRTVWPCLAMQIRADFEALRIGAETLYLENDVRAGDPELRVSYYFLYMYAQNRGETLSAREALANLTRVMDRVSDGGRNANHFLDQFVFYDESPQFRHWAKIDAGELPFFLLEAVDLLKSVSRGYGIWGYFDYRDNHLYNPSFLRGLDGWEARGEVTVRPEGDDGARVVLGPGASIRQRMVPDWSGNATGLYESVRFSATARARGPGGHLRLSASGVIEATVPIAEGPSREVIAELERARHQGTDVVEFGVENGGTGPIELTALCVWGFVYRAHLYDEEGRPGRHLPHVRRMNRR